ncbi:MAG: transposase [Chloroflexi bacterium]|nr:transposase [Chloroflexota bacterium]
MSKEPDPQVEAKGKRRRFSARYKLRILAEADNCTERGEVGALLRREGLYSSHLTEWRKQRDRGALEGLRGRKRGLNRFSPRATVCIAPTSVSDVSSINMYPHNPASINPLTHSASSQPPR